ncbi:MAG: hypothetical protein SFV21_07465 [Rhodospirillaceae bacterium]|nr:hypothetical protein [Rhodospirillaceae bacterium]
MNQASSTAAAPRGNPALANPTIIATPIQTRRTAPPETGLGVGFASRSARRSATMTLPFVLCPMMD